MTKIAVDMMGSDLGPKALSSSIKKYLLDHDDVSFLLFGDEKILSDCFFDFSQKERLEIILH